MIKRWQAIITGSRLWMRGRKAVTQSTQ